MFGFYVKLLIRVLPYANKIESGGDLKFVSAHTVPQQFVIIGNAAALAEDLLPSAVFKEFQKHDPHWEFISRTEKKSWKRSLRRFVGTLRDFICEQHVSQIMFEDCLVKAELYCEMYNNGGDDDRMKMDWLKSPMPSSPFQVYIKHIWGYICSLTTTKL
jgi:hypothetical protein